jgi:Domain of unknown function (DUF4123)
MMLPQPPSPMDLDAFLEAACAAPERPDGSALFALIDHAGAPGLLALLKRVGSLQWRSLFEDSTEANAIEAAPLLVALPRDGAAVQEREFLRWVYRHCCTTTCVITLRTEMSERALFEALRRRMDACLPDDMPVMLRCFDTRTLSVLPGVLTEPQRTMFFSIASRWFWLNRCGQARMLSGAPKQVADTWPANFRLTEAQEARLIESGAADAVLYQLVQSAPDVVREHGRLALYILIERLMSTMRAQRIESVPMQALYCVAEIDHGPEFASTPRWKEPMTRVAQGEISFAQAIEEVGA